MLTNRILRNSPRIMLERLAAVLRGRARPSVLNREMPCFFVLSTGRTGTKTLAELLNKARGATVYHEPHPYLSALSKLAYETNYQPMEHLVETFLASREVLLRHAWASGLVYGETGPYVTFLAPVIARALPNSKFIHLVRDPVAVVRSGLSRGWYQGHRYDARRITPRPNDPSASLWPQWTPLEKVIWLWAETNRFVRAFIGDLPEERRLLVRAEDLFAGRAETIEGLFRFAGLPKPAPRRIRRVLDKRLNRQRGTLRPLESWIPDWPARFRDLAGDEIARLGYTIPWGRETDR